MSELKLNRRQALTGAAVAGAAVLTGAVPAAAAAAARTPEADTATPFGLGVASGDPLPDGVILWTRLVRDPFNAGSMPARALPVAWQVAADERFHRVVRAGVAFARPELAHSVHVDVRGLAAGRDYFYRFRSAGQWSAARTSRTATGRRSTASPRKTSTSSSTSATTSTRATRRASSPTATTSRRRR